MIYAKAEEWPVGASPEKLTSALPDGGVTPELGKS